MEKNRYPYPYSQTEKELWEQHFWIKTGLSVKQFVEDIRDSMLRIKYDVERICEKYYGVFDFVCEICFQQNSSLKSNTESFYKICIKKPHSPQCVNGHEWKGNQFLVFIKLGSNGSIEQKDSLLRKEIISLDEISKKIRLRRY